MEWLRNFNVYNQGLILSAIIIFMVLVFNVFIFVAKIKPNKNVISYTYSFASGFLLITAVVGQFVSARSQMTDHWNIENNFNGNPTINQTIITMLVISIGFILGVLISFIGKLISVKYHEKQKHTHSHNVSHSHALETLDEHVESHSSGFGGTFMVIAHRIPAGIAMGMLINLSNEVNDENLLAPAFAFSNLLAFVLHIFPESFLMYLSLLKAKNSRLKAFLLTSLFVIAFVPLIMLGIAIGSLSSLYSTISFVIGPILFSCISAILLWGIITELVPIFIHSKGKSKEIYFITFTFMAGILLSCLIQLIHFH